MAKIYSLKIKCGRGLISVPAVDAVTSPSEHSVPSPDLHTTAQGGLPTSQGSPRSDRMVEQRTEVQKRGFLAYAGEDKQFVALVKDQLEPYVGSLWVDWENVVLFEDTVTQTSEPAHEIRIRKEIEDASLIIFVVSRRWVGKWFPMQELSWASVLQDFADRVLPVLLDWSLTDAHQALDQLEADATKDLLNHLLSLTVVNADGVTSIHVELAKAVAAEAFRRPGVVLKRAPEKWIPRQEDVTIITQALSMPAPGCPLPMGQGGGVVAVEGMSGVGKSALLRHLYDVAVPQYVAAGFCVVYVEVGRKADKADIEKVQKKILKGLKLPFHDGDDLEPHLRQALGRKGYLLFLDDVWQNTDDVGQLRAIFGEDWSHLWFEGRGKGSSVIVAGQALPNISRWTKQHKLEVFTEDSARLLFCKHAFQADQAPDGCILPWQEVVSACDRLPLALQVFGSQLRGNTDASEWNDVVTKLESSNGPLERLEWAYDSLSVKGGSYTQAFVDIAMFWHGKEWTLVGAALGSVVLKELMRRNLVDKVERFGVTTVGMHDLLKGVGRGGAEQEKSWLVDPTPEDVASSGQARGVALAQGVGKLESGLKEVRVLDVSGGFSGEVRLENCPKLRWLQWPGIRNNVSMGLHQAADLLWLGLHDSGELNSLPDLSALIDLQHLDLKGCKGLTSLPNLSALTKLQHLDLSSCERLTSLPDLSALTKLQSLNLRCCEGLTSLPDLSALVELQRLNLSFCKGLTSLPDLSALTKLHSLNLMYCARLTSVSALSALTKLQSLNLRGCEGLTSLPDLSALTKLQSLYLYRCEGLTSLPDLSALTKLQSVDLSFCKGLTSLPDLSALTKLQSLDLTFCKGLTSLPDLSALTELQSLNLLLCEGLTSLPDLSALTKLQSLNLYRCEGLTSLPDLSALTKLHSLDLKGCKGLTSLPHVSALTKLQSLNLTFCKGLTSLGMTAYIHISWMGSGISR